MEKCPQFSIIIPLYNAQNVLARAVQSVKDQNFSSWELLLIDDASTDKSAYLATRLAEEDSRIRFVSMEKNSGAAEARNRGIREAQGKYLMFLDADDVYSPGLLMKVAFSLEENPAQVVLWGLVEEYRNRKDQLVRSVAISAPAEIYTDREKVRDQILNWEKKSLYGYLWNKAYQADALRKKKIEISTQDFNEDEMFNIAFFQDVDSVNVLDFVGTHYEKRCTQSLTNRYLPHYYPIAMARVRGLWEQQCSWGKDGEETRRELASLWLRYVASALERNCDFRSQLNHRQRKEWVQEVWSSDLALALLPYANPQDKALFALSWALKKKNCALCLMAGRTLHIIKHNMPGIFQQRKGLGA